MNNKGISLIMLIATIIMIMILCAVIVSIGFDGRETTEEERCLLQHGEHQYITISKYDTLNQQYYNVAICTRCGHELNAGELKNK